MEMLKWIKSLFTPKKQIDVEIKKPEEPKLNLHKMTKGDLKKLYAQGKIKASQLKN
jgi:hypothetical protein|tara:strand:- start:335 stop:502 length:168 start_codon:yes stop_codon:yes gene_type:complete